MGVGKLFEIPGIWKERQVGIEQIIAQIDQQIAQLQQVSALLAGRKPSPKKNPAVPRPKKKRNLTPDGRKRIAEAVKRRWAAQKEAAN